jgi:hypothetical protein
MRRIVVWLGVALCTFTLGFMAAALWLESRRPLARDSQPSPCPRPQHGNNALALDPSVDLSASANLPILAYCELVNNPDRYSGKVVRVSATLGGFIHGILFYEESCPGHTAVAIRQDSDEVRRTLTEAAGSEYFGHVPLDLIVVGRFEKVTPSNESDLVWHTAPLHFEIMRVEKASKAR